MAIFKITGCELFEILPEHVGFKTGLALNHEELCHTCRRMWGMPLPTPTSLRDVSLQIWCALPQQISMTPAPMRAVASRLVKVVNACLIYGLDSDLLAARKLIQRS